RVLALQDGVHVRGRGGAGGQVPAGLRRAVSDAVLVGHERQGLGSGVPGAQRGGAEERPGDSGRSAARSRPGHRGPRGPYANPRDDTQGQADPVEQLERLQPLQEHGGSAAQQVNVQYTVMKILAFAFAALLPCLAAGPDVDKGRTMGDPAAPLMFELYSDFMCPGCKPLHESVLPAIVLDYVKTGKAYLIFREFPLNAHKYSRQAAALAVAAARIGRYQTVSDA